MTNPLYLTTLTPDDVRIIPGLTYNNYGFEQGPVPDPNITIFSFFVPGDKDYMYHHCRLHIGGYGIRNERCPDTWISFNTSNTIPDWSRYAPTANWTGDETNKLFVGDVGWGNKLTQWLVFYNEDNTDSLVYKKLILQLIQADTAHLRNDMQSVLEWIHKEKIIDGA
jgi:hypothetical protein